MTKSHVGPFRRGCARSLHTRCAGAPEAIEFSEKAFNAVEIGRIPGPERRDMVRLHGGLN